MILCNQYLSVMINYLISLNTMIKYGCRTSVFNHPTDGGTCLTTSDPKNICNGCRDKFKYEYQFPADHCVLLLTCAKQTLQQLLKIPYDTINWSSHKLVIFRTAIDAKLAAEMLKSRLLCDCDGSVKHIIVHYDNRSKSMVLGRRKSSNQCRLCYNVGNKRCIGKYCVKCCMYNSFDFCVEHTQQNDIISSRCLGAVFNEKNNCARVFNSMFFCGKCNSKFVSQKSYIYPADRCVYVNKHLDIDKIPRHQLLIIKSPTGYICAFKTKDIANRIAEKNKSKLLTTVKSIEVYFCDDFSRMRCNFIFKDVIDYYNDQLKILMKDTNRDVQRMLCDSTTHDIFNIAIDSTSLKTPVNSDTPKSLRSPRSSINTDQSLNFDLLEIFMLDDNNY